MELDGNTHANGDDDVLETREWLDSFSGVLLTQGRERAHFLLDKLKAKAARDGVDAYTLNTPYVNTIPPERQAPFPGDRDIERRIKSLARWNALAMVVQANRKSDGIGGHIASYASGATLYEVGFNHFFHGPQSPGGADFIYFQGHSTPGIYARSFLEGRLPQVRLENFRRELAEGGGLSSYPHPWLMPDYWQFPTVSMGLGPIMAIYHARFLHYLEHRGIKDTSRQKVWAFLGDGETDEPESLGALTLASREKLDNLIFVVNCNLQRLDGPVRGNGKIIQELEAAFRGAGWNVIKVIWGSAWDPLLAQDYDGLLVRRMNEAVDGEYQRYSIESRAYTRQHFFGKYPELLKRVEHMSDDDLARLTRGGHDPIKVYAAYAAAVAHQGAPTVILAKTVKGYGLGDAGEGQNTAHNKKKMEEASIAKFRKRFNISLPSPPKETGKAKTSDAHPAYAPFYKPADDSPEMKYLHQRRQELGGYLPCRAENCPPLQAPGTAVIEPFLKGSGGRAVSTTMAFADLLRHLLKEPELGKYVVPIIPDEARTFGMEDMFTKVGIYSSVGQLYEPVDFHTLTRYREDRTGQILEEGITEAGSMSSFIAAGTAYANLGVPMVPFFIYYSMFGFQRVGDLIWAAADMRCRGFLVGGTAGRTTLAGEGLQHQDGHSHILASTVPTIKAYDPAFAYEIALIVQDGIRRMYEKGEHLFYYFTVGNENYPMEPMPAGAADGVVRGMYKFRASAVKAPKGPRSKIHLLGSGAILREVLRAQAMLADQFGVPADVWSVTSYKELRREALECERWNRLHPAAPGKKSYLETLLAGEKGIFIAASDYLKSNQELIQRWVPGGLTPLGTDGFGRSENRSSLRRFFEVDAESITVAALDQLARRGEIKTTVVEKAIKDLGIDPDKPDPVTS